MKETNHKEPARLHSYHLPTEVMDVAGSAKMAMSTVADSASTFDEDGFGIQERPVPGYERSFSYIPFGIDDLLPYHLIHTIMGDEIMSQNLFFNALTTYGEGLRYTDVATRRPAGRVRHVDPATGAEETSDIGRFAINNSLKEFFLEQATDMKFFFFSVAVVILNRDGTQIVQIRHKEAEHCRFEKADAKGRINHVFYANWRKTAGSLRKKDIEVLTLLDEKNPLGHLEVLMGRAPGADGETRVRSNQRKFALVMRFPTPGQRYYPTPYYTSIFRGDWFDLKRLIGKGKKAKIRNHAGVKYHVEIDKQYWDNIIIEENIIDPVAIKERIKKERENIRDFVTGIENSGKMWITGCYTSPDGKEQHLVRINVIDTSKEGGDWSDDINEAANMICYGTNIHPNLVGASPGKSNNNNSGSDKRELFTLKQSLETAFRDMLAKVHQLVIYFNGWQDVVMPEVPIILLTTLDKNTDAKKVSPDGSTSDPNE